MTDEKPIVKGETPVAPDLTVTTGEIPVPPSISTEERGETPVPPPAADQSEK